MTYTGCWELACGDTTGAQQPATAYVRPDGSYVVVNDATGNVVQVSDATNPNWKLVWNDPRFQR